MTGIKNTEMIIELAGKKLISVEDYAKEQGKSLKTIYNYIEKGILDTDYTLKKTMIILND
jgi:predicted DNA-binding transcriptional regulator AlpA